MSKRGLELLKTYLSGDVFSSNVKTQVPASLSLHMEYFI